MPFPNEHAARQRPPGDFVDGSFRRFSPKGFPSGIDAIGGRLKSNPDGSLTIQSIRAKSDAWTPAKFRAWLEKNDLKTTIEEATSDAMDAADSTERVRRYDRMQLRRAPRKDKKTGFLHVDASLTRAPAVFEYRQRDGSVLREFRPAEHVFGKRNVDSIKGGVVTDEHPPVRVTTKNVRRYQVGQAGSDVRQTNDVMEAPLTITDETLVQAMENGKRQVSLGYDCGLVMKSGVWTDSAGAKHPYDAIQTDHETNHIAIVSEGRAGPQIRAHMDRTDAEQVLAGEQITMKTDRQDDNRPVTREDFFELFGGKDNARVTIDGVQYELPVETAKAVAGKMATDANEVADQTKRGDRLEAERDDMKVKLGEASKDFDEAALRERIDARIELEDRCAPHFDEQEWTKAKKLDDAGLRRAVVEKVRDGVNLDDKSADYIEAAFDMIEVPEPRDDQKHLRRLSKNVVAAPSRDDASERRTAIEKEINDAVKADNERWQKPVPHGLHIDSTMTVREG